MKTIKIQFWELSEIKETPIIDRCRYLLKKGEPEDCRLEIYRENEEPDVIVPHIGNLARLRICDIHFEVDHRYLNKMGIDMPPSPVR